MIREERRSISEGSEDGNSSSSALGSSSKKTGFIKSVYDIASNEKYHEAIGWNADGTALEIRNCNVLISDIFPLYFKHANVASFIRQLNNYGFRTKPSGFGVFQTFVHEYFQKDHKELLNKITRRPGQKKVKKKSLYEQVTELKKKEESTSKQMESLVSQVRGLREQNEQLIQENQRLHLILDQIKWGAQTQNSQSHNNPPLLQLQLPPPPTQHPPPPINSSTMTSRQGNFTEMRSPPWSFDQDTETNGNPPKIGDFLIGLFRT